ncbi:transposase [Aquibacillus sp. 3ASR75-11]|uniref:Transposase n=1 Tax=Terrihalobacillus insolitus TaxID=2950438 RepID=A0A9X4ANT6_9BACI|nr:transposase [Terrihalobacillus insolitus]MDC3424868.1 transposase [Terrihalobacillus insolitus]
MARETKPTYTIEFPLHIPPWQQDRLEKKFKIARNVYNACLGEALKRHKAVKSDKEYRKLLKESKSKERDKQLSAIRLTYGFSEYGIHSFVKSVQSKFKEHIGSFEAQKLATRAFHAVEKLHFGKSKKVHFKNNTDDISVENKSNKTGLRFVEGNILWGDKPTKKNLKPKNWLSMPISPKPKDEYAHLALMDKTKYVRILKREVRGKCRYFVQLIQEGYPPTKRNRKTSNDESKRVGIDIGTSTIAICSEDKVQLQELAPECKTDEKELRSIQRKMDRSKRSTNPNNFNENGTAKTGRLTWAYSKKYEKLRQKRKELYRKMVVQRKMSHEKRANEILSLGSDVRVETMRFQSLQKRSKNTTINKKNGKINRKKRFGKSIANRAPSMLLKIIDRKLGYQGCSLKKIDTYATKASQFNHISGAYSKKQLSERWSDFGDFFIQRDLYSAFLIRNTNETFNSVDVDLCNAQWNNFVELHNLEIVRLKQSASKTLRWFVA